MPIVDLPLDQLQTYAGRNPKPADFDAFWERGLAELAATEPAVERIEAYVPTPAGRCYDLYFTGTGGARVHAKLLVPHGTDKPGPAICTYHGYTIQSDEWFTLHAWASCGFTVASMDCRGQGGLSEDAVPTKGGTLYGHIVKGLDDCPEKLYYRNVFLDAARLVQLVSAMETVDSTRVVTYGGSQGGGLALAAAALAPTVSKCISIYPFLCDYQRVWEMDLARSAYVGISEYFKRFDPMHERQAEVFTKLGYIDVQHLAPRIEAEVLHACGLMDTICPPSSQFAAYNKIQSAKRMCIYPDYGHEHIKDFNDHALSFALS